MSATEINIPIPRAAIEPMVREIVADLLPAPQVDAEAQDTRIKIERLMAKPFWSIAELAFVWGCSDTHVRNLLQRVEDETTEHPIPFCNLDGLVVFDRDMILGWMRQARPMKKGSRKSGGKKHPHLEDVSKRKTG